MHDGLWIVGDYRQDQFLLDGTFVMTWQLHWVTGWDADAGEYGATLNDNHGHADVMRGRIDGDRLLYESTGNGPVTCGGRGTSPILGRPPGPTRPRWPAARGP